MRTPLLHETLRECLGQNGRRTKAPARMRTLRRLSTPDRWRAVEEYGFVWGILLQRHRDTESARTFLTRLLGEYDVPDTSCTDQVRSYGAAIREILSLADVDHQQLISTARCNNMIEQRASVASAQPPYGCAFWARSSAVLPKTISPTYMASGTKRAGVLKGVRSAQEVSRGSDGGNERRNF